MNRILIWAIGAVIAAAIGMPERQVFAQSIDEITVTARKREENLQEIPIAITAISSEDIMEAQVTGLEDVSSLAPGFYFFNQGQSQPGRYNTQLRFRGLNQAQFSPSFETGALFVDGPRGHGGDGGRAQRGNWQEPAGHQGGAPRPVRRRRRGQHLGR